MKRSLFALTGVAGVAAVAGVALVTAGGGGGGGYGAGNGPSSPPALGAAPAAGAPAAGAPPAASDTTASTLMVGNSKFGPVLVDGKGLSLYLFQGDKSTTSSCTSAECVSEWPPLAAAGTPQAATGLAADQLGTTTRADGRQQVTYGGHPLYRFAGDTQSGTTAGQGLNDNGGLWYLLHSDGMPAVG